MKNKKSINLNGKFEITPFSAFLEEGFSDDSDSSELVEENKSDKTNNIFTSEFKFKSHLHKIKSVVTIEGAKYEGEWLSDN